MEVLQLWVNVIARTQTPDFLVTPRAKAAILRCGGIDCLKYPHAFRVILLSPRFLVTYGKAVLILPILIGVWNVWAAGRKRNFAGQVEHYAEAASLETAQQHPLRKAAIAWLLKVHRQRTGRSYWLLHAFRCFQFGSVMSGKTVERQIGIYVRHYAVLLNAAVHLVVSYNFTASLRNSTVALSAAPCLLGLFTGSLVGYTCVFLRRGRHKLLWIDLVLLNCLQLVPHRFMVTSSGYVALSTFFLGLFSALSLVLATQWSVQIIRQYTRHESSMGSSAIAFGASACGVGLTQASWSARYSPTISVIAGFVLHVATLYFAVPDSDNETSEEKRDATAALNSPLGLFSPASRGENHGVARYMSGVHSRFFVETNSAFLVVAELIEQLLTCSSYIMLLDVFSRYHLTFVNVESCADFFCVIFPLVCILASSLVFSAAISAHYYSKEAIASTSPYNTEEALSKHFSSSNDSQKQLDIGQTVWLPAQIAKSRLKWDPVQQMCIYAADETAGESAAVVVPVDEARPLFGVAKADARRLEERAALERVDQIQQALCSSPNIVSPSYGRRKQGYDSRGTLLVSLVFLLAGVVVSFKNTVLGAAVTFAVLGVAYIASISCRQRQNPRGASFTGMWRAAAVVAVGCCHGIPPHLRRWFLLAETAASLALASVLRFRLEGGVT